MIRNSFHIIILFSILVLSSCSIQPFLEKEEQLVAKNDVKIIQEDKEERKEPVTEAQIKPILRPRANGKFLGTNLSQYIWLSLAAKSEKKDTSKFRNFIQKQFGQEPRFVDTLLIERSLTSIENYLFNNGYFNGKADYSVKEKGENQSIIEYQVYPNRQHVYGRTEFQFKDSIFQADILDNIKISDYLKQGEPFAVDDFTELRNEMVKNGLEKGYYFFSKGSVFEDVDTLRQDGIADIYVVVENDDDSLYNRQFYIRDIFMKLGKGIRDSYKSPEAFNNKMFSQSETFEVKPKILDRFILFNQGELYSRKQHLNTINKLYDLPVVKYANIDFRPVVDSTGLQDSLFLDVFIDANAQKLMTLSFEPTISEFEGPAIGADISLVHRNIFGGGELFDFTISGSLQSVNNAQNENQLFGTQLFQIEPQVVFPRLLGLEGFVDNIYENTTNQRTTVAVRYGFQNYEELYNLRSLGVSQRWEWQSSPHNKHVLTPIDVNRIRLNAEPLYQQIIQSLPSLQFSLQNRLLLGSNYTYSYSNRLKKDEDESYLNFSGTIDLSGNLAYLLTGEDILTVGRQDTVSQFIRTLGSFTYHTPFSNNKYEWVNHISGGVAFSTNENLPYIPAVKQFFLGGSSSMRAWRPRALGPGTYFDPTIPDNQNVDLRGDIMMEFNSEFRYPVTKVFGLPLRGALFTDIGNIWAINEPPLSEGGRFGAEFKSDQFYKELAVAAGTGLRLDIQNFLIVRGDFAWKLREPSLPEGDRWVDNPITLNKTQFQLGIGYPFEN